MTDSPDDVVERLGFVMASTPSQVGVAMGYALFGECRTRGLLSIKTFSALGLGFLPHSLPAYKGINFAFVDPKLDDWDFRIGEPHA